MSLKDHLGNFSRIFTGAKSDTDFEVSDEYFSSNFVYNIRFKGLDPNLDQVDEELIEAVDLDLEQVLNREYDENSFSEEEKGFISASRNYAREVIEDLTDDLTEMRARSNHASFEGAEYSIPEQMQENEEYLEKLGLI